MKYDPYYYPYKSKRTLTYAKNGVVATSQHLASQAGLDMLKKGGNAIDAAIATAICLTVVEPTSNGIGGDAFALVWTKDKLHGLNSSGPSPEGISAKAIREAGNTEMPKFGWTPVTVPGAPAAWGELSKRFGRLPFKELFNPAIEYAKNGYPVSPSVASAWQSAAGSYKNRLDYEFYKNWADAFIAKGKAPKCGQTVKLSQHAKTLQYMAEHGSKAFYQGEIAEKIDEFSKKTGGFLRKTDLEDFKPEWVDPIGINYRGYDIWEIPPNGQGMVALMALNILKGFEFYEKDSIETYHKQIEAMKLAFTDGKAYITDQRFMKKKIEDLLSDSYAKKRRKLIKDKAVTPKPGQPDKGGTVYLATADNEGNMVSYIQSNYMGFGSGVVVPKTGIALQNRGANFSLVEEHDNCIKPKKRTYHTIIPGFMSKGGKPVGPFGVMGGFMQPQGHVQVVMNMVDFGLNPQAALDAPRWQWQKDKQVIIESEIPDHIFNGLSRKGHAASYRPKSAGFGRGQIILRNDDGVLAAGTELRADSGISAW